MVNAKSLLADLQRVLRRLEADIRGRCEERAEINHHVRAEYEKAREAGRTSLRFESWLDEIITQAAVAWILACVFVRFVEDNKLVDEPRIAGVGTRLQRARDEHTAYFRRYPTHTDREYLEHVFRVNRELPALREIFDERHNTLWTLAPTGDGATALLDFWQQVDPQSGALRYDFGSENLDTRFLGDLYQDLSETARKRYALLQTPVFVEEFILDRTLTPAVQAFGYRSVRLIDPTCGSGHFLLGAFERLMNLRFLYEPSAQRRAQVQEVLNQVYGVDLNPFAVSIARFRLLVAALRAEGIERLRDAPGFRINLVCGDSLLHGARPKMQGATQVSMIDEPLKHVYEAEDAEELKQILRPNAYHVVVGNPPYITVKDPALNAAYRRRFRSCHMKYSLAVPFMERFFDLALPDHEPQISGDGEESAQISTLRHQTPGFVGMITANSFMKREFGKKLVEQYVPRWDLTHVVDTSGAYIPGHGTPTVILFARERRPVAETVRAVMGIKGEPSTPEDAARGQVWTAIVESIDLAGTTNEFVSVTDASREMFHRHPWSIGGGGAAELKEQIDEAAEKKLTDITKSIGITAFTLEDDIFLLPRAVALRHGITDERLREMVEGEFVRDWMMGENNVAIFPYDKDFMPIADNPNDPCLRYLWRARMMLANNKMFGGKTKVECGLKWYEFGRLTAEKLRTPLSITFAFVATHNHFFLDRGGKVFKQSAPIIKLPPGATEDEHLALLGLLNSSTACFWMKQLFQNKGSTVDQKGARQTTVPFENFYEFTGTGLQQFPVPKTAPLKLAQTLDRLARELQEISPAILAAREVPHPNAWRVAKDRAAGVRAHMIALQEELDWAAYRCYDLIDESLTLSPDFVPSLALGERAFEIVLARRIERGELQTTWFARHSSSPRTSLPADWSPEYCRLVERRIELIETDSNIRLIEQPEYKRRWNTEAWDVQAERALRRWLLDRLESAPYRPRIEVTSCHRLADIARKDAEWMQVAAMYRGAIDFDADALLTELVRSEAVPFLPILRYKPSGLRHRSLWEECWAQQREEDRLRAALIAEAQRTAPRSAEAIPQSTDMTTQNGQVIFPTLGAEEHDAIERRIREQFGNIPVPPKYKSTDFLTAEFWRQRGKLDVPRERFISYPGLERDADHSLHVLWAGFNYLERAYALADFYARMKDVEGWTTSRLVPVLAGLLNLLPWLRQWHNELDPVYNLRMGDYFNDFLDTEARVLGLSIDDIRGWKP